MSKESGDFAFEYHFRKIIGKAEIVPSASIPVSKEAPRSPPKEGNDKDEEGSQDWFRANQIAARLASIVGKT